MPPATTRGLGTRLPLALIEAAAVVAILYFLGHRDWLFMGSIAAAIGVSALAPPRLSLLVSGVSLLALATLFYFHFKFQRVPIVLGVLGLIAVIWGARHVKRP
ncbi:MAG: hypothetical protein KF678_00965 [Phycisphaeraceae bacterium]|nr:hypothetical protein [Phycisphaeraceae bacterium]